jgi:cell division protein FtsB
MKVSWLKIFKENIMTYGILIWLTIHILFDACSDVQQREINAKQNIIHHKATNILEKLTQHVNALEQEVKELKENDE